MYLYVFFYHNVYVFFFGPDHNVYVYVLYFVQKLDGRSYAKKKKLDGLNPVFPAALCSLICIESVRLYIYLS